MTFLHGWARHAGDSRWHAISTIEFNGSTITRCRGRWPTSDNATLVEEHTSPPEDERCKACSDVLRKYAAFDLSTVDV